MKKLRMHSLNLMKTVIYQYYKNVPIVLFYKNVDEIFKNKFKLWQGKLN
jgi:hypothetical protein